MKAKERQVMDAKEYAALRKRALRFLGSDHGPYVESCVIQFAVRELNADRERRRAKRERKGATKP